MRNEVNRFHTSSRASCVHSNNINRCVHSFCITRLFIHKIKRMSVKHKCPGGNKVQKLAVFSIKVTVKVTRSLTLVSFERVSLVCMQNMKSLSLTVQKLRTMLKGGGCHKVADRWTNRTRTRCPRIPYQGHKNKLKKAYVAYNNSSCGSKMFLSIRTDKKSRSWSQIKVIFQWKLSRSTFSLSIASLLATATENKFKRKG